MLQEKINILDSFCNRAARLKGRGVVYKEKLASILVFSELHSGALMAYLYFYWLI